MSVDKQGSLTQLAQASFDPISQGSKVLLVDSTGNPYSASASVFNFGPDTSAGRVAAQIGNSSGPNSLSNPVFTGLVVAGAVYDARVIRALTASDVVSSVQSGAWAVSVSASALPTGASTSANQSTEIASLTSIDGKLTTVNVRTISSATDSIAVSAVGSITNPVVIRADTALNQLNALKVDASATTQPISATALPLPSGASTSAIQSTQQTSLTSIDGKLSTVNTRLSTTSDVISAVQLGTWNIGSITGAVTLPTGASTASAQASAQTSLSSIDSKLTTVAVRALTAADVVSAVQSGSWSITNITGTIALPNGASTSANQTTANANLSSIDGKTLTAGQKASVASYPVVISSDQSAVPVVGTVTANVGTTNGLALDASVNSLLKPASTLAAVTSIGSIATTVVVRADTPVNQINAFKVDGSATTQPVSGTVAVSASTLPSGASTSALQTSGNASLASIDSKVVAVNTGAVVISSSALPSGASTEATLASLSTKVPTGLTIKAASTPALATDQALVVAISPNNPITLSGEVEIKNDVGNPIPVNGTVIANAGTGTFAVSASTLPLPSGASTEATLSALNAKVTAVNTGAVTVSSSVLPSGAATATNQATTITSLNSIDTKTPALGQALAAASVPVVLTAAQLTTLTPFSSVSVSNFPATQAVSGTITANIGTTNGIALDTSVNSLLKPASTLAAVTALGSITSTVVVKADTSVNQTSAFKVDGSAVTQPVSAASLPLPSGASTSALQTSGNASLVSIDSKVPALGQALSTASVPVVLTASQVSTLTPLSTITANIGTTAGIALDTSVNSLLKPASTLAAVTTLGTITNSVTIKPDTLANQINALKVDGSATTQPISASTLPLPSGAATSAIQTTQQSSLTSIDGKLTTVNIRALSSATDSVSIGAVSSITSTVTVKADTAINQTSAFKVDGSAVTQPVSGTVAVSNFPASQAISGAVVANIGTTNGLALDTSVNSLLKPASTLTAVTTVGTITNTVTVKADTLSNQVNAFKVDASATTQPVSATALPLPTGASTFSAQTTAQASFTSIDSKTLTAGQKTSANSYPVVLASDQGSISTVQGALSYLSKARVDYTGTSVTTAAYTTLIATVGAVAVKNVDIFDSSGQTLVLAIGAAGVEVDQFYITPGGVTYSVAIPANTRLSIKAVSATASTGAIAINIFG